MQGRALFKYLQAEFNQWLIRLGYAESSTKSSVRKLHYFLDFLAGNNINKLEDITPKHLKNYQKHLETKPNKTGGSIQSLTIQGYISTLKLFDEFLFKYEYPTIVKTELKVTPAIENQRNILSKDEITEIYKQTDQSIQGFKDRAMLGVYYGCGLRSREGMEMKTSDIDFKSGLLQVRKGKYYRQRYVPMSGKVSRDIKEYINYARPLILKPVPAGQESKYLLVHSKGKYKYGNGFNDRLKLLAENVGISKTISLHSLRHSIATHLMQEGMQAEQIRQFLGHHSLETTQRYIRIINDE